VGSGGVSRRGRKSRYHHWMLDGLGRAQMVCPRAVFPLVTGPWDIGTSVSTLDNRGDGSDENCPLLN